MLKDKSVVITGSAKGIGRYIAHGFAKEGAKVAIADVDETRLQQTLGELGELGAEAMAVPTDVTSEDAVRSLMAQVNERFGGIDVLINDAAIVPHFNWNDKPRWPKIQDMETSFFWDTVMGVALRGSFLASKHAVPYMEQGGGGNIVNLHGGGGLTPRRRARLRDGERLAHHVHEVPCGRGARLQHLRRHHLAGRGHCDGGRAGGGAQPDAGAGLRRVALPALRRGADGYVRPPAGPAGQRTGGAALG